MTVFVTKDKFLRCSILCILTLISLLICDMFSDFYVFCWYIVVDVALILVIVLKGQKKISIFSLFIMLTPLFHFGQVFLYIANLPVDTSHSYDLFAMYSEDRLHEALTFCLKGYNLIALTASCISKTTPKKDCTIETNLEDQGRVFAFGKTLFWVLLIPIIFYDVTFLTAGLMLGYMAKYNYQFGFLSDMDFYYPFAMFCIIIGAKDVKQWRGYFIYTMIRLLIHMLIVGNRGTLIIYLILYCMAVVLSYRQIGRPIILSTGKKIILAVGILAICIMISFVAIIRGGDHIALDTFFRDYNVFSLFISEFGSTLITPIIAQEYVTMSGHLAGKNYLGALAAILPLSNVYLGGIRRYMNVIVILNPISPLGGALGGSIFADMIMGFGNIGYWLSPIVGMVVAKVSNKFESMRSGCFGKCMVLYFCFGLFWYIRGNAEDIGLTLKRMIYMFVLYTLYCTLIQRRKK